MGLIIPGSWVRAPPAPPILSRENSTERPGDCYTAVDTESAVSGVRAFVRTFAAVDLRLSDPVASVSGLMPSCLAIRASAPPRVAGSCRASTAIRVARSRSPSGYFLGAAMTLILPLDESLHQTRRGTVSLTDTPLRPASGCGWYRLPYADSARPGNRAPAADQQRARPGAHSAGYVTRTMGRVTAVNGQQVGPPSRPRR
jgi:hypothetical protein